jgi:hypothetical protein
VHVVLGSLPACVGCAVHIKKPHMKQKKRWVRKKGTDLSSQQDWDQKASTFFRPRYEEIMNVLGEAKKKTAGGLHLSFFSFFFFLI